jgi:hypothetical protein
LAVVKGQNATIFPAVFRPLLRLTGLTLWCLIADMKSNFVLVVAQKPINPVQNMVEIGKSEEWQDWIAFCKDAKTALERFPSIQNPIENLWLFDLCNGVEPLHRFLALAQGRRQLYRVVLTECSPLVFDENGRPDFAPRKTESPENNT